MPVVSTDVGDARDIVGDCGRIVTHEADAMAAALDELCQDASAMGPAARARVVKHYGLDSVVQGLQQQYLALRRR